MSLKDAQSMAESLDQAEMSGRVAFILARIKARDISKRQVALLTGIGRTRLQTILHTDADKRSPMKMDEYQIILKKLGIGHLEVALAAEVIGNHPNAKIEAVSSVVLMLTELLRGLPEELLGMVYQIDGLEHSDVRPEHGGRMRELMLRNLGFHYRDIAGRREIREIRELGLDR